MTIEIANFGGNKTPEQTIYEVLEDVGVMDAVVVVYRNKDKTLSTAWSDGEMVTLLGLLVHAQNRISLHLAGEES